MTDNDWLAERFQAHRPRLRAIAYRILGSPAEADDAVQETWLRLNRTNADEIDHLEAWLVTAAGRVALNMLRSRRTRREDSIEVRLPEPTAETTDPEQEALLADSVGLALLVVLERLSPAERLAFVLHDMFSVPFTEIGTILDRSPDAARQLASRGRRRVRGADAPAEGAQQEVVDAFLAAAREGDFKGLLAVLDPDVVVREDRGDGDVIEVRGAEIVAGRAASVSRLGLVARPALVNGGPGWISLRDDTLFAVAALTVHDGRITQMDIVLDPERLARIDRASASQRRAARGSRSPRTGPNLSRG